MSEWTKERHEAANTGGRRGRNLRPEEQDAALEALDRAWAQIEADAQDRTWLAEIAALLGVPKSDAVDALKVEHANMHAAAKALGTDCAGVTVAIQRLQVAYEGSCEVAAKLSERVAAWSAPVDVEKEVRECGETEADRNTIRPHLEEAARLRREVARLEEELVRAHGVIAITKGAANAHREMMGRDFDRLEGEIARLTAALAERDARTVVLQGRVTGEIRTAGVLRSCLQDIVLAENDSKAQERARDWAREILAPRPRSVPIEVAEHEARHGGLAHPSHGENTAPPTAVAGSRVRAAWAVINEHRDFDRASEAEKGRWVRMNRAAYAKTIAEALGPVPETLTRGEAHRRLLALGMPVDVVIRVLDEPQGLLPPRRDDAATAAMVAIVDAYQRHLDREAPPAGPSAGGAMAEGVIAEANRATQATQALSIFDEPRDVRDPDGGAK